ALRACHADPPFTEVCHVVSWLDTRRQAVSCCKQLICLMLQKECPESSGITWRLQFRFLLQKSLELLSTAFLTTPSVLWIGCLEQEVPISLLQDDNEVEVWSRNDVVCASSTRFEPGSSVLGFSIVD